MSGRIILLEPSLTSAAGHFAVTAEQLRTRLAPTPVIIVPGTANRSLIAGEPNRLACFRHSRTAIARRRHYGAILERLIRHTEAYLPSLLHRPFARSALAGSSRLVLSAQGDASRMASLMLDDLLLILSALEADPEDLLMFPSADAELILAIAELHKLQPVGPAIALRLMYDDLGSHASAPTWRSTLRLLFSLQGAKQRVHLFTETLTFATAINTCFAATATLFPHPSPLTAAPVPLLAEEFVLYVPGKLRTDKGVDLVRRIGPDLGQALRPASLPRVTLRAQSGESFVCEKFRCEPLPSFLHGSQYTSQWQNCHAALLLNDPTIFALRGSGTVCDAVASHRPFLALRGSSLGEWIINDNGVLVEPDAQSISDGIVSLLVNYQRHRDGCHAVADHLDACLAKATDRLRACVPGNH
jgi:hypothetical protein